LFFPQSVLAAAGLKLAKTCLTAATPDHLVSDFFFSELIDYSRGVSRLDMCISLVLFFAEFAYLNKKKCAFSVTQSLLISLHQRGAYMIESY